MLGFSRAWFVCAVRWRWPSRALSIEHRHGRTRNRCGAIYLIHIIHLIREPKDDMFRDAWQGVRERERRREKAKFHLPLGSTGVATTANPFVPNNLSSRSDDLCLLVCVRMKTTPNIIQFIIAWKWHHRFNIFFCTHKTNQRTARPCRSLTAAKTTTSTTLSMKISVFFCLLFARCERKIKNWKHFFVFLQPESAAGSGMKTKTH